MQPESGDRNSYFYILFYNLIYINFCFIFFGITACWQLIKSQTHSAYYTTLVDHQQQQRQRQ